jgi:hypothetical protein
MIFRLFVCALLNEFCGLAFWQICFSHFTTHGSLTVRPLLLCQFTIVGGRQSIEAKFANDNQ